MSESWGPTGYIEHRMCEELTELLGMSREAYRWLDSPHRLLGGDVPREVVRRGEAERVWALIEQLKAGAYI